MKRFISFALTIAMLFGIIPMTAMATGERILSLEHVDAGIRNPGDTFVVNVNITGNEAGYFNYGMYIDYDENLLSVVSVEKGDASSAAFSESDSLPSPAFADLIMAANPQSGDGTLAKITFQVNEGAKGTAVLTLVVDEFGDEEDEDISSDFTNITTTITIEYETTGLTFNNGSQTDLTYDQVKAEAEGAEGAETLTKPGENYYFAGWFTGLNDVTADANGYYVVDPATKATFTGTEFRPRYENPPTEGEYHALWIKGDGTNSYVLTLGETNTVHFGATPGTVLSNAIATAKGNRTKLVMDLDLAKTKVTPTVSMNLDMNGCKILAGTNRILTLTGTTGNVIESSRVGGTFKSNSSSAQKEYIYGDNGVSGQFDKIRDIDVIGSKSNQAIYLASATEMKNCKIEGYIQFSGTAGTTLIDNCSIDTSSFVIMKLQTGAELTVTNTTISTTYSSTNPIIQGTSDTGGNHGGTIKLGAGNKITATSASYLLGAFNTVEFTSLNSTYQIKPGAAVVNDRIVNPVKTPDNLAYAVDGEGYVRFGESCTITYIKDDGTVLRDDVKAVKGYGVDLSLTYDLGKQWKHIGWTTDENGTTPLTSLIADGDITLYSIKARKGVIFNTETKEYESGNASYTYGTSSTTPFTIYNADRLGELDGLTLIARSTTAKVVFSAEALDYIAAQINGELKDISVVLYYKTSGLTMEGAKVALQFSMTYNGTPIDLPENGVEVQIKIGQTSTLGTKRQFTTYEITASSNEPLDTTLSINSSNYWANSPITQNATFEVVMAKNHYLPEADMTGNVSVTIKTAGEHLVIENAKKLADLNSLSVSGDNIMLDFSAAALASIADLAAAGSLTIHLNNVTPTAEGAVFRAELLVKDANGNIVNFTGAVEVTINFPFEEGKNYRAYYVPDEGEPVGLRTTIGDYSSVYKKAVFTTTHFSAYEIREISVAPGYTAGLDILETEVRAGGNAVNVSINVTHLDNTSYNAGEIKIAFNSDLLTFDAAASTLPENAKWTVEDGVLTIAFFGANLTMPHSINLVFTTCATVDEDTLTTITLTSAKFADSVEALDQDLAIATLDPASDTVTILLETIQVTLPTDKDATGTTDVVKGDDYDFTVNKDEHYDYVINATMGGETVPVIDNGDGTYTIAGVTAEVVVTIEKTAKNYGVTFEGEAPAANDGAEATHDDDYQFTLPTIAQHQVNYTITINGVEYTGASASNNVITIPGSDITGAIVVTITKTQTEFNVTLNGSDAAWTDGNGGSLETGDTITVTITPAPGYSYTVTATQVNGTALTVTNSGNVYSISGFTSDITIDVTKTLIGTANVSTYIQLEDGKVMFLVTFEAGLADGYVPYYGDKAMYWSAKYDAYCYLVIDSTLSAETATAAISVKTGTAEEIDYSNYNVNQSTDTDAADAQLVYNMYTLKYDSFALVEVKKFLNADLNGDAVVNVNDAVAIINHILSTTN